MINRNYGYAVQKRKNGFYGVRTTHRNIPPDGHWRFILACAQIAHLGLYISDVKVTRSEIRGALHEANHYLAAQNLRLEIYSSRDILNLKTNFGL